MLKRWLPSSPQMRLVLRDKAVIWIGVAFLFSVIVWIGSIWVIVHFHSPSGLYFGFIDNGQVSLNHTVANASPDGMISFELNDVFEFQWWFKWYKLGTFQEFWGLEIPLWVFVLILASLLAAAVRRAARRSDLVRCPACGYSRIGLARSSSCPECGRASQVSGA